MKFSARVFGATVVAVFAAATSAAPSPTICDRSVPSAAFDLRQAIGDYIELGQGTGLRHVLGDLPGTLIADTLNADGTHRVDIYQARRYLKPNRPAPQVVSEGQVLMSRMVDVSCIRALSLLSYIATNLEDSAQVRFSVAETAHSTVSSDDVDWAAFEKDVADLRVRRPDLARATFGVIGIATSLSISDQAFRSVTDAKEINGWGFAGSKRFLTQVRDESRAFKTGVVMMKDPVASVPMSLTTIGKSNAIFVPMQTDRGFQSVAVLTADPKSEVAIAKQDVSKYFVSFDDVLIWLRSNKSASKPHTQKLVYLDNKSGNYWTGEFSWTGISIGDVVSGPATVIVEDPLRK